jgi:predicted transcriptional regulator
MTSSNNTKVFPTTQPRILVIDTNESSEKIEQVLKALASDKRIAILHFLSNRTSSINEIAEAMEMPASTATMHLNILENAGLVHTELKPANRGLQKMCSRVYDRVELNLPQAQRDEEEKTLDITMPIGAYVDCQVVPTCGLLGEVGIIGELDNPTTFYHPERIYAQLLWFRHGYVEYRFPNPLSTHMNVESLQISLEVCSEAPHSNSDWPSNITMWINGLEIGTWTCPGDFGGQRGALTPDWWDEWNTQYGLLKMWRVNHSGSYIDGVQISTVTLNDVNLGSGNYIAVRIGVKNEGMPGGLNIFGEKFGNYPQSILMRLRYRNKTLDEVVTGQPERERSIAEKR